MTITIDIEDNKAVALADAIRRAGFRTWRALAIVDAEAFDAQHAAEEVRRAIVEKLN